MTSPYPNQPPQPPRKSRTGLIVGLSVGGAAFALLCCLGTLFVVFAFDPEDDDATASEPTPVESPTPDPGDEPLGDELRLEITAEVVEHEPASQFVTDPHTAVYVEVTNTSDDRVYVGPLDWYAEDDGGFKHEPAWRRDANELSGLYLDPGQATAGVVTFEGDVELAMIYYQRWPSDEPVPAEVG